MKKYRFYSSDFSSFLISFKIVCRHGDSSGGQGKLDNSFSLSLLKVIFLFKVIFLLFMLL